MDTSTRRPAVISIARATVMVSVGLQIVDDQQVAAHGVGLGAHAQEIGVAQDAQRFGFHASHLWQGDVIVQMMGVDVQ